MTYQVLARKWRPQTFATLVGQQHVMQALVNSLDSGRLHHAYLFTGTRGVGKTTIARLIAKALNCEQGVSSQPCGICSSCTDIAAGRFVDLLEVDAASRTKVEDTRDLLDNVQYAPTRGRYKVYLIDEVHMLSGHSFNALLKTLEEPPAHVKFLLATTDPQKLPITVLSRCIQFHLKNLQPTQISHHLVDILTQEKVSFELPALQLLAQAASGSMRDALSLLDQAIATGGGQVDVATVELMLGVTAEYILVDLLEAFLRQDLTALLAVSEQLHVLGADYAYVLARLQEAWHRVALLQFGVEATDVPFDQVLVKLAKAFSQEEIQLFYEIASLGRRDLALSPSLKAGFEMVLLRLLAFKPQANTPQKVQAAAQAAPEPAARPMATAVAKPTVRDNTATPPWETASAVKPAAATTVKAALPQSVTPVVPALSTGDPWVLLLPQLGLTAFSKVLAEHLCFERQEGDHFYLSLAESHAVMLQERHQRKIIDALSAHFHKPMQLTVRMGNSTAAKSPLQVSQDQTQTKIKAAWQNIEQDTAFQRVVQTFDAKVLTDSLTLDEST